MRSNKINIHFTFKIFPLSSILKSLSSILAMLLMSHTVLTKVVGTLATYSSNCLKRSPNTTYSHILSWTTSFPI